MSKKQGFSAILLIIILAVLIGGGYWAWKNQTITPPSVLSEVEETPTPSLGIDSEGVDGWKTYQNEEYGFEFQHPIYMIRQPRDSSDRATFRISYYWGGELGSRDYTECHKSSGFGCFNIGISKFNGR